jgi:hypothetical protein
MGFLPKAVSLIASFVCLYGPMLSFVITTAGICKTMSTSVARLSAVLYWLFWPLCRFALRVAAVIFAWWLGAYLWFNYFQTYHAYKGLQAYGNVDSYSETGNRLQDAGLVLFNSSDGVDRSKGACIVNGHTYCVAPIMHGGVVEKGVSQTASGMQDLFMAGVDCCDCPITDFRCGDWADPTHANIGGMRLLDEEARNMYHLAVEKWDVDYDKKSGHSIFFHWSNDPVAVWKSLQYRGTRLAILAIIAVVFGSVVANMLLNCFMHVLILANIAAPIGEKNLFEDAPLLGKHYAADPAWVSDLYHAYNYQKLQHFNGDGNVETIAVV